MGIRLINAAKKSGREAVASREVGEIITLLTICCDGEWAQLFKASTRADEK